MPDFFDRLKQDIANRQSKEQIDSANLTPLQRIKNNRIKNIQEQNAPLYKQRGVDTSIAATGGTEQGLNDEYEKRITDKEAPFMENRIGYSGTEYDQQGNDTVSKTAMAESFLDNGLTSLQRGTGTFVDGWGSIIQIVNAAVGGAMNPANFKKTFNELMESNNELSSMMQEFGKEMAAENTDFQTDDLKNPTFSFDTFLNPEFWSTYGGEFIPQLAEIAASYGAGGLLKNAGKMGVEAVVKGVAKKTGLEIAEEVAEESAKKGLLRKVLGTAKTTTTDAFVPGAARAGVEHTLKKGSGILGAIATEKGALTKGFAETLRATGAGSFTNLSVSLRNAGEIYNTYKNAYKLNEDGSIQRDESGQPIPLFTKEELGQMARDTFVTNSQYIGADILSWGLTYGKGLSSVKGIMGSMTEETAKKTAGEIVSKGISPFLKNLRKLGTKMAFEGAEETVQETYEEWSKMKSYSDMHGSLDGYQGKISQEYNTKGWGPFSSGFWDYYKSKDSESVRVISAALGAIAGGVFNASELFNKQADNAYKLEDRWNNINKKHNTPEGKDSQRRDIYRQMSEAVMEGKGGMFTEFIDTLYNENKIDETDYKRFAGTYDQIASNYGKIKDLKMKGQKAFMLNVAEEIRFNDDLNEANENYKESLNTLSDAFDTYVNDDGVRDTQGFEKQKAELDKEHQQRIIPLVNMIAASKKNQKNLILGKDAKPVEYKVEFKQDPVTGEFIDPVYTEITNETGLTQTERENAQKRIIEEFQAEEGTVAGTVKGWWNKAKSYFGKNAEEEQKLLDQKNNPATEEKTGIAAQVDGAIEELANSFSTTEDIDAEIAANEKSINENSQNNAENEVKKKLGHAENQKRFDEFTELLKKAKQNMSEDEINILLNNLTNDSVAVVGGTTDTERNNTERGDMDTAWMENPNNLEGDYLVDYETALAKLFMWIQSDNNTRQQPETATGITKDRLNDGLGTHSNPISIGDIVKKVLGGENNQSSENNQKVAELQQRNQDLKKAKEFKSKPAEPKTTIQQTNQEPNFGTKDYEQFKNNGNVGSHAIDALALQILDGKELTKKQTEVYEAFKSEVDEIVDNPSKFVDNDETLSEEEKAEVKNMMKNISGKKSINSTPEIEKESEEKITVKPVNPDIFEDRRDMRQEENKYFNKEKIVSSGIDIVSSALSKLRRKKGKAVEFFESDFGNADFEFLSQSIGVSNALKKVYPGMNTNVYAVRNMQNTIGVKSLGFALAGQIYIDESKWNQDKVFMHEVAHIYFALTKESDDTQRILNSAFKNKDLVNDILNRYEDRIQYRKKDGELVYRSDLFNNYENLSQEERDDLIDRLLKEGFITNVPLLEQEVIADEVFAAYLQGPLSDKYTKYFTEKDSTLEDEPRRKYLVKKWWGKVKQDGANLGNKKDRESFFKSILTEEEQEAHSDSLNSILDQFTKGIEGKNISAEGRASLEQDENQKISDRLAAIERSIESERQAFVNDETLVQKLESGSLENLIDDIDFNNFFDDDNRFAYTNKITPLMMAFTRKMNKGISYLNNLNGKKSNWKQLPYVKADQLRYQMSEMAKVSWSGSDFIRRMESSPFYEVTEFMKHLDKINRGDKNMVMQMFYWHENNTSNISSFKNYVNPSGESQVELNLSNKEKTQYENLMENIKEPFFGNNRKVDRDLQDEYIALNESLSNIQSGDYTRSDINNVTRFLVRKEYGIDSESLIAANRININGKAYALDQIIVSLATDESGNGFIGEIRNVEGARNSKQKQFIKKVGNKFTSGVYKLDANKQSIIKPGIRMVVQGLINENRKYRADYTVVHADNNMHQARIIDNYLSRNFKYLKEDVSRTTRNEFISKHSLKNNEGKGMLSNKVAGFIYDKISNGGDIDLLEYGGIQNAYNNDKRMTLKTSDPVTERLSQFVTFLNTDKSGTYIMDLGRFSDSTRAFYTEMPKTDISEIVTFGKNGIEFTNRAFLDNIYNTHKALGYNGNFDEFKGLLMGSIRDQIAFVNDNLNSFKNDKKFQKLTDPQTGLLNKDGQMKVAEFEMNQIINGTNFTEIFFPSFQMQKANGDNELVKRAKSASSPMFTFPNTRVEPIYLEDIKVNELDDFEATDSGFYILEDDAERFRSAGGNMMPLGNSFKLIHTGIERNAPGMMGQNIYNKGFATVLNEEVVIKNPALRGAYELLKARKAKYEAEYGKPSMNLLDGTGNYIPMIVPISANKSNNLPDFYDHKSTEEKSALMNFQSITDAFESGSADFNEALNQLDQMYYEDGDFIGADGSNFGIQQVMDIDKDFANTSVQFVKSLTSNMALNENEDQIFDILKDIQNLSEQQLSAGMETLMNGSDSEIRDFIKNLIDPNLIDQTQQFLLFNENVSLQTPAVKQIVKNTIANYIKQNGLKIKTPGGILREKPSLFEKEYATSSDLNATSGNYGLSFYQNNSKGTVSKGEVVIPESMIIGSDSNKPNKLNVRKYFVSNSTNQVDLEEQMKLAKMEANNRGTSVGKVFNASGKHIGFYAAGDTILATRIPSHGIQSTGVFEVVGTTGEKGNNIQLPNEFKKTIGSDNDGDQIFVQHKGKRTGDWNKILDKIEKHYLNPQMQEELRLDIDFKDDAKKAVAAAEKIWGSTDQEFTLPFSSRGRQKAFEDTLIAKANVGLAANLHTTLGMFRNYGIGLKVPINIDGNYADQFMDAVDKSISINSAKNFNIILDNSKNAFANKLGIDTNTIPVAMVLTNLGFDLDQVAIILNSPMLKRYSALKSNNTSAFNKDEKYNVMEKLRVEFGVKRAKFSEINIDTKNIKSQNTELYNLIGTINQMESELSDIGAVLSIHNTMTVNPFEINDVIRKFDNRMDPENNRQLITNDDFKNSPIVQNYKNVLLKNQDVQKKLDPVYSGNTEIIYNEITGLSTKEMSSDNHKSLYSALDIFHTSQALGLNNIDRSVYESLTKYDSDPITKRPIPGPRNIFENLSKHMISEKKDYSFYDKKNPNASVTNFENSLLFSQGMNLSLKSNNKYISLNSDFFNNSADDSLRTKMINEFSALPTQLKNDLMLYDLMKNGWSGPNSLFPLFESNIKQTISVMSKENKATNIQLQQLKNKAIFNNPDLFRSYDNAFVYDRNGYRSINPDLAINNESLLASFKKGEPFIFRTKDKYGNDLIQKFKGFDKEMRANLKLQKEMTNPKNYDQEYLFPAIQNQISKSYPAKYNSNPNLDYITIKNPTTLETGVNDRLFNETNTKPLNMNLLSEGREMRSDWWNFARDLSREEYDEAMEYSKEFTEERKKSMHNIYVNQKLEADRLKTVINADTVKEMSNDELLTLFDSRSDIGKKYGNGIGFGNRNKFAYAEITLPIVRELATRAATDQTLITGREYDGNDISLLQKYFMTGNVPSNHPAVQNLVRRMESEYKIFLNERNKIVGKINDATNQLYKEQLGYEPYGGKGIGGKVKNYIKNIETNLFGDKEQIYKKLYGPLINVETKEDGSYKDLGYKPREVIEKEYKEGNISEAQYNFYNVSRETTDALKSFALPPGKSERTNYIPHVAPANWEILSRRGLLGLMVNAKTVDEKINDVKMDFENPLTGEMMKGVSFKLITDMYNTLSASENRSNKHALDYVKLKRKAIILNKKGINQDGSAIFQSPIEIGGALGDVFVDRFANGRSVKAQDFPSMDLNKAFVDYTHATLFQHGNENFQGFKKMVPVIDGILAQADSNKDKNIAAYVDKVWKQYFIGGQKQSSIPNIPALEAMGITSDKVVDYITKGSLVYWLGWKGLAMGAGAYAIGNVLIGKFNNVVEAGGTEWLKGEKRFWMGKSGKFEITDPFKGIREAMTILKNAGFMDINVYDDVNIDNRNSIEKNLINIALFPMTWSEKWIQGVHFLGKLNDQEWEDLKDGNTIDPGSLTKYEDDIKAVHGRGYQPTDQRMIQMYSWGRAMMQFNRYIPTMFNSLFGKKDIDRYGNVSIGTYTALLETIQKGYRGEWNPKTFVNYYKNLDVNERKKLNSALVTMGLVSVLGAVNTFTNSTTIDKLISDSHLILNSDRLAGKLVPAPVAALDNMF